MSTVLVTGASGFLGRPLVSALLAEGRPVLALCRNASALSDLRHPALRAVSGDLRDSSFWHPLLREAASVFHLAAVRNLPSARAREMEEVNVTATLDLARQAGEAGVARFVNVATALIYGPSDGPARSEADGIVPERTFGAYARSRAVAAREIAREIGQLAVTVCPAVVYGPDHPSHPNRVTQEIRRLLRRRRALLVAGGRQPRNLVYVDDVVRGLLAAERLGKPGEAYILGGEEISHRELAELVFAQAGIRGRLLSMPAGMALAMAVVADWLRRSDPGCGYATGARILLRAWRFDSGKARRGLGFEARPLEEGLARTINWLGGREER
jgi:nucleoside-diphosphate-sugar epimerase